MGSSLTQVTCETSQVLLVGGLLVFSEISCFCPIFRLTRLKMSEIILTGCKTKKKKKKKKTFHRQAYFGAIRTSEPKNPSTSLWFCHYGIFYTIKFANMSPYEVIPMQQCYPQTCLDKLHVQSDCFHLTG